MRTMNSGRTGPCAHIDRRGRSRANPARLKHLSHPTQKDDAVEPSQVDSTGDRHDVDGPFGVLWSFPCRCGSIRGRTGGEYDGAQYLDRCSIHGTIHQSHQMGNNRMFLEIYTFLR